MPRSRSGVNFTDEPIPLTLIYDNVYQNVSGQVLEIDKYLIPPGHLWSRLFATRYLIGDDYDHRGYITQKLIDLGYIAKTVYTPIIPPAYLFMQSCESAATWFRVDAVEVDPTSSDPDTQEDVSYATTVVAAPPDGSVINFDVEVPAGAWFILGLNTLTCVGMQLDTVDNPDNVSMLYAKRRVQQFPSLEVPIAFPTGTNLIFDDQDNNQYVLRVNDAGELFWTPYVNRTPQTLFAPESLFWRSVEPVLEMIPDGQGLVSILNPPDTSQASYAGLYLGLAGSGSGYAGTVTFEWRLEDVGDCPAGTFPIESRGGESGAWSTSGELTVAGIREEASWGPG
jgi:hypothetical protein